MGRITVCAKVVAGEDESDNITMLLTSSFVELHLIEFLYTF